MLIRFKVSNYRSFKEQTEFSMKASAAREHPENTIQHHAAGSLLKSASVFGANAAGKSNFIRAITSALMIIRTSDNRQVDEIIPYMEPYAFCQEKGKETSFEFEFVTEETRFIYGFSCTERAVAKEYLKSYSSQRPSIVFSREGSKYSFHNEEARKQLSPLTERNNPNKLFLATATAWGSALTKTPYLWLRHNIEAFDLSTEMLHSLEIYEKDTSGDLRLFTNNLLKEADINITDFTVESGKANNQSFAMRAMRAFPEKEYRVMTEHIIKTDEEENTKYKMPLQRESRGTQNLFFMAPWIKRALDNGYVFCVDELDSSMHPALLIYIVKLFNSPETNPKGAQLIMTSHTTDILSTALLRRDQIFFVEKDNSTGTSEMYSLKDFSLRTREDIRKAYMAGRFGSVPDIL